ncbi:MAG: hypothetical protein UU66_C0002G0003 [Parcubacteria group bacterium GW2011_GWB1_41_5]|nr:MAG: hypothetical protein UU66_C0002G0003 [Parcubacteria group bacterium GW2011_GWB1_41_5]
MFGVHGAPALASHDSGYYYYGDSSYYNDYYYDDYYCCDYNNYYDYDYGYSNYNYGSYYHFVEITHTLSKLRSLALWVDLTMGQL